MFQSCTQPRARLKMDSACSQSHSAPPLNVDANLSFQFQSCTQPRARLKSVQCSNWSELLVVSVLHSAARAAEIPRAQIDVSAIHVSVLHSAARAAEMSIVMPACGACNVSVLHSAARAAEIRYGRTHFGGLTFQSCTQPRARLKCGRI